MEESTKGSTPEANAQESQTSAKTGMKLWKKIALGAVAAMVLLFMVVYLATKGIAETSDAFVDSMLQGNSEEAYTFLSTQAKEEVDKDSFTQVVDLFDNELADTASQKSRNVEGETGSAATGSVSYEISGSDGTYELIVNLIKEDGEWKVLNFENSLKE